MKFIVPAILLFATVCGAAPAESKKTNSVTVQVSGQKEEAVRWLNAALASSLSLESDEITITDLPDRSLEIELPPQVSGKGREILSFWSKKPGLEFASVHKGGRDEAAHFAETGEKIPSGWRLLPNNEGGGHLLVAERSELNSEIVSSATVFPRDEAWMLSVEFTDAGSEQVSEFTKLHRGDPMAIILDGSVLTAPVIQEPFSTGASITGNFTESEARALAAFLSDPPDFDLKIAGLEN